MLCDIIHVNLICKEFECIREEKMIEIVRKNINEKNKIMLIVIGIIVIILALLFIGGESESETFLQLLDEERYQEAEKYYENVLCKNEREIQNAYGKAVEKMNDEIDKYNNDETTYEEARNNVLKFDSFYYVEASEVLSTLQILEASKTAYNEGEVSFFNGDYYAAFNKFSAVVEMDLNYSLAQKKLDECSKHIYESVLFECEKDVNEELYTFAIYNMQRNLSLFREEELVKAQKEIEEYIIAYANSIEKQVEGYWKENKYAEGFKAIEIAISNIAEVAQLDEVTELVSLKQSYTQKYEEYVRQRINEFKLAKAYSEGATFLNEAQQILPDSEPIKAMFSELKMYLPIELSSIEVLDYKISGKTRYDAPKDFMQNEYSYGVRYMVPSEYDAYVEYNLEKVYEHFSCIIAPSEKWSNILTKFKVTIWADDKVLYETIISRESQPLNVELNVAGVEKLRITFEKTEGYHGAYILFADAYLFEKYEK